ncbi:MAG TPA: radical SAM protein [Phycisphaerae bacterium]|nr:radical SAM protein [Phycisphaerae bacterium]
MADLPLNVAADPNARRAFALHSRAWQSNRYVYPVVSRRSKGISIGVNLNPDKICNFDCIYCSVERKGPVVPEPNIDIKLLRAELSGMLELAASGKIYRFDPFDKIPAGLRRINDIAFSGDGEPTTCPQFADVCRLAAELKDAAHLAEVKLVLITNATMFHRPAVQEALAFLDRHNGEIWAKLDAGTEAYYDLVDRTAVPFSRVLENLKWCAARRPTVIQSLFMKVHGKPPSDEEVHAYGMRLAEIEKAGRAAGGGIKLVQLYTVARQTTEAYATPLSAEELTRIQALVTAALPGIFVEVYP